MIEDENFQWIWGVLSAFPKDVTKDVVLKSIQHPLSVMEIIAWDSSMTIFISRCNDIVEKLAVSNPLAEDLEEYNTFS